MSIKVLSAGPLSTIQDAGRFGYLKSGIGTSGVMDREAYDTANRLLQNTNGEAVIETTLMGPTLLFDQDCICCITGADMMPMLDGQSVPMYQPFLIKAQQTLSFSFAVNGCRGYLAFAGGIDVPLALGSRSTNLKCRLGGYQGRALQTDDILSIGSSNANASDLLHNAAPKPSFSSSVTVRVIEGPQAEYFTDQGKQTFYGRSFAVAPESDRMGYRLDGPGVESKDGVDIVSDGIAYGAVQIPPNGKPIILLSDRQTTGGYAKIATVVSKDIPKIAQLKPGDQIRFQRVELTQIQ